MRLSLFCACLPNLDHTEVGLSTDVYYALLPTQPFVVLFFFCDDTMHITCPKCGVYQCALHASVLCPSEICVALRKWRVQFTATLACIVLAFALGDRPAVDKPPLVHEVRAKVVIRGEDFFVPEHYPKDACDEL